MARGVVPRLSHVGRLHVIEVGPPIQPFARGMVIERAAELLRAERFGNLVMPLGNQGQQPGFGPLAAVAAGLEVDRAAAQVDGLEKCESLARHVERLRVGEIGRQNPLEFLDLVRPLAAGEVGRPARAVRAGEDEHVSLGVHRDHRVVVGVRGPLVDQQRRPRHGSRGMVEERHHVQQCRAVLVRSSVTEERLVNLRPINGKRPVLAAVRAQSAAVLVNVLVALRLVEIPDAAIAVEFSVLELRNRRVRPLPGRKRRVGRRLDLRIGQVPRRKRRGTAARPVLAVQRVLGPVRNQAVTHLAPPGDRRCLVGIQRPAPHAHIRDLAVQHSDPRCRGADQQGMVRLGNPAGRFLRGRASTVDEQPDRLPVVHAQIVDPRIRSGSGDVGVRVTRRRVLDQHANSAFVQVQREQAARVASVDQHLRAIGSSEPRPGGHGELVEIESRRVRRLGVTRLAIERHPRLRNGLVGGHDRSAVQMSQRERGEKDENALHRYDSCVFVSGHGCHHGSGVNCIASVARSSMTHSPWGIRVEIAFVPWGANIALQHSRSQHIGPIFSDN